MKKLLLFFLCLLFLLPAGCGQGLVSEPVTRQESGVPAEVQSSVSPIEEDPAPEAETPAGDAATEEEAPAEETVEVPETDSAEADTAELLQAEINETPSEETVTEEAAPEETDEDRESDPGDAEDTELPAGGTEEENEPEPETEPAPEPEPEPESEPASEEEPESENREVTYVLNANPERMRYHLPTCSSVDSIKPENLKYFYGTREEAEAEGYVPCGRCHPDKN